ARPGGACARAPGSSTLFVRNIAAPLPIPRRAPILRHARQTPHGGGGSDPALVAIGLVIGLDVAEPVEIVDHDPGRLLQALGRAVAQPVELLDPRAVAEMEM